jgi:DNA-binding MarR family transcriptional regulator
MYEMMKRKIDILYSDGNSTTDNRIKTFILFTQTAREVFKYIDARLIEEAGISMVKFITLQVINHVSGVMNPSEIAKWTQTERNNVTTLIRRMEKEGLVKVERNVYNKKYVDVTITDEGREVLARSMATADDIIHEMMHLFTDDDMKPFNDQLYSMLNKAHVKLEESGRVKRC